MEAALETNEIIKKLVACLVSYWSQVRVLYRLGHPKGTLMSFCLASYGTAKAGVGISAMSVLRPDLMMRSVVPVVMAGIIAVRLSSHLATSQDKPHMCCCRFMALSYRC